MGKDQIVQCLARLRQDAAEGQPLEPERETTRSMVSKTASGVSSRSKPSMKSKVLCPKEFAFAVIGPPLHHE
jgi:hypothetical protein